MTFDDCYAKGLRAEKFCSRWLIDKGYSVVNLYEYTGRNEAKAPRINDPGGGIVLPDILAVKDGKRFLFEVKNYADATPHRITGRLDHGILKRHWEAYKEAEKILDAELWLFVCEDSSGDLLGERISDLEVKNLGFRIWDGPKDKPWKAQVYFERKSFNRLGDFLPLAPTE